MKPKLPIEDPQAIFSPRFEFKYRLSFAQAEAVRERALVYLVPDAHSSDGAYPVNSLYFDTPGLDDLHEMDEGIALRSKVRIRTYYRTPQPPFFLELKQRFGTTIQKTRAALSPDDALRLATGVAPLDAYRGRSTHHELDAIREVIDSRGMAPHVWVRYNRHAYVSEWGDGVRITFDRAIEAQSFDPAHPFRLSRGGWLFPEVDDRTVLEMKFLGAAPAWMQRAARQLELDRVSVSKYGLSALSPVGSAVAVPGSWTSF